MSEPSPRIADQLREVRVGVRPELEVSRHVFGGQPAYVVRDPVSFHSHRLSKTDYQVFSAISDRQKLSEIHAKLVESGVLNEDQEEDFYRFVVSLTQRGLLNLPLSDGGRLYKRFVERQQTKRKGRLTNALFLRVPLIQPDRFLNRTIDFARPLFTRTAFAIWLLCFLASLAVVSSRWEDATSPLASILTAGNIPVLWALLVGLKVIHEFGHAYACKRFGGVVPEMGAYFILFTPCAYVDASASWGFTRRWERIVVALAGMYFESIAAMFALAMWVLTPPGAWHDAAHYALVLSTIVTVAFNANPLMRYDGYYVLSDAVGMPNLRSEAERQVRQMATRVLYGVRPPRQTEDTSRLRDTWLLFFGVAATLYKVTLVFGISLVVAQKVPLVGIAMAAFYVLQSARRSLLSLFNFLRFSEELNGRRRRAVAATAFCGASAALVISVMPIPGGVETAAVVAPLEEVTVRAKTHGFVGALFVRSGDAVSSGHAICQLENIDVEAEAERLDVETIAQEVIWKQALFQDREAAGTAEARLAQLRQDQQTAAEQHAALSVRADHEGVVTTVHADRSGAFLRKGDPIVTLAAGPWTLRALLTGEQLVDADLRPGEQVRFRLVGRPADVLVGRVLQVAPQGLKKVERTELTQLAGGKIAVDPASSQSADPLFEVTVEIAEDALSDLRTGSTAQVRFVGERTTLLRYLCRRGLQLINDLRTVG